MDNCQQEWVAHRQSSWFAKPNFDFLWYEIVSVGLIMRLINVLDSTACQVTFHAINDKLRGWASIDWSMGGYCYYQYLC